MPTRLLSRRIGLLSAFVATLLLPGVRAGAQGGAPLRATRSDLERRAAVLETIANGRDSTEVARARAGRDAARLRERLRDGDFQVGDRIVLQVPNDPALTDTFTVAAGRVLALKTFGAVPLTGVLRSELEPQVQRALAQYFREPQVTATALVRVGVLGAIARPGYYAVSPDLVVSDVLMQAGGPTGDADIQRTLVRRGERELWSVEDLRQAMRQGLTLDQMSFVAGDEIVVGKRKQTNWAAISQITTVLIAIVGLALTVGSN